MTDKSHLALGSLAAFHDAGVLEITDVQVAAAVMRIGGYGLTEQTDLPTALGAALCVRALRAGSVCVDLAASPEVWQPQPDDPTAGDLPWPAAEAWPAAVATHPLVSTDSGTTPLRLTGSLLYLQRYWQDEDLIRTVMAQRSRLEPLTDLPDRLRALFPDPARDLQRLAVATSAARAVSIIAGGPGTGKTTTVARIIALLRTSGAVRTVALAAPTGKAAARLQEAIAASTAGMSDEQQAALTDVTSSTLHRLLGWRPEAQGRFRHDRANPLPHDLVIVDESSMVSLPMMARLLEAVRTDARVVLVGDPDQLASIDAGAVLGDLVTAPTGAPDPELYAALAQACPAEIDAVPRAAAAGVVQLDRNYRFQGAIAELAGAIQAGDADAAIALLTSGPPGVVFEAPEQIAGVRADVIDQATLIAEAAQAGDPRGALDGLERHRVLCAHRDGPYGVSHWDGLIAGWTARVLPAPRTDPWYVGRTLLVTANDYTADLYNGDTGVIVAGSDGVRAAFQRASGVVLLPVARLDTVQTLRAMTIHRGQGSQFDAVTVVLPDAASPLLTRELLYTAVTRARSRIRIIGTEDAVRAGVQRLVRRASGLRDQALVSK